MLQYAFTTYDTNYSHDLAVIGLGLGFIILSLICMIVNLFCYTGLNQCCKCCKQTEKPVLQVKYENATNRIKDKLSSYFKARLAQKMRDQIMAKQMAGDTVAQVDMPQNPTPNIMEMPKPMVENQP